MTCGENVCTFVIEDVAWTKNSHFDLVRLWSKLTLCAVMKT